MSTDATNVEIFRNSLTQTPHISLLKFKFGILHVSTGTGLRPQFLETIKSKEFRNAF